MELSVSPTPHHNSLFEFSYSVHQCHTRIFNPLPVSKRPQRPTSIRACTGVGAAGSDRPLVERILDLNDACWRFLRPHTIRGTALGSFALVARALIEHTNLMKWSLFFKAFSGLFALICGNGYIVGINQIYDISIDKVNKPYLPIAAGDLSVQSAWFLVIFFCSSWPVDCGVQLWALHFISLHTWSFLGYHLFRSST
ncbi:hypothetical protein PHAVU_007G263566 [Phaseolus vulgaris]